MAEYEVGFQIRGTIKVDAEGYREVVAAVSKVLRQQLDSPRVGTALDSEGVRMRAFPEVFRVDIIPASAMVV